MYVTFNVETYTNEVNPYYRIKTATWSFDKVSGSDDNNVFAN